MLPFARNIPCQLVAFTSQRTEITIAATETGIRRSVDASCHTSFSLRRSSAMYKTYRESSTKLWRHLLAIILVPIAIGIVSPAALAESPLMTPRAVPQKPAHTQLTEMDDPRAIVIKFAEGTDARLRFDPSPSLTLRSSQAESLHGVLRAYSLGFANFHRLFDRPEGELDEERQLAQRRSGRLLADLNLYFRVNLPESVNSAQLCDDLNALSFVELARPLQRPAPPPVDIPPKTGDFGSQQVYLYSTVGIGMVDVMSVNGADGSGLTIVDIEYAWVLNHEDLELTPSANIDPSTIYNPFRKRRVHTEPRYWAFSVPHTTATALMELVHKRPSR